jgi:hypothetical protein
MPQRLRMKKKSTNITIPKANYETENEDDEFHDTMSKASETKRAKSPPKKRKVDEEPAADDASKTSSPAKPTKTFYCQVVYALPPSGTLFDLVAELSKFERPSSTLQVLPLVP